MFDDLSELNDYEVDDPFYHTNFLNKLSSNLENQTEVNFSFPPIEKRSRSIPPPPIQQPVSLSGTSNNNNNATPKEVLTVEALPKRNSISNLQNRVINAISTINESYRRPWREEPKKLLISEGKNIVLAPDGEKRDGNENTNKSQTNSPLKIIKHKSTKLVQQIYFNSNNIKKADEVLLNYRKLRIESDVVKLQDVEPKEPKRQSSTPIGNITPELSNNKQKKNHFII